MAEAPKKKIVYENRPIDNEDKPIEDDYAVVEPIERPVELPEPEAVEAPVEEVKKPEGMDPMLKRSLLVGATPLLFGLLTGNAVEGAQVSSDNLINEDKIAFDQQNKNAKSSLERMMADSRLKRELARNLREDTKLEKERVKADAKGKEPHERKHIVETTGPNGEPIIRLIDDALNDQAWKSPAANKADNFHLKEKMELESHKAGLKSKAEKDPLDPYKTAKGENELYRMYQKDSDTTKRMGEAYARFKGTLSRPPSAANDLAVVFNYMRILDPGSTVREGEQASAANATSVPDAVRQMYNRLLLGADKKLPDGLRERFFGEATAMYDQQLKSQGEIDNHFKGIASRRNMDSRNIIRRFPGLKNIEPKPAKYSNGKETILIDLTKLTPRMKRDLERDNFKETK